MIEHRQHLLSPALIMGAVLWMTGLSAAEVVQPTATPITAPSPHWAFVSPTKPPLPEVGPSEWPKTPVDHFVLDRLKKADIIPSPEASRTVLIRRLSFGLRGLPPTFEEIKAFQQEDAPGAWERLVDRFLASPAFGVRWAQHWLDAVGYADSNGYFNADSDRPLAYQYRDYAIASFNANKPFDQFVMEQLAGDELIGFVREGDVSPAQTDSLVATHFLRNAPDGSGESDGNPLEVKVDRYSVIEGSVQIIGSSLMGLTLQCARCHDHKFEPVLQSEYYGLQAILRPAFDPEKWLKPTERVVKVASAQERQRNRDARELWEKDIRTLNESIQGVIGPFKSRIVDANMAPLLEPVRKALKKALETPEKDRNDEAKKLLKENETVWNVEESVVTRRFHECAAAVQSLRLALSKRESEKPHDLQSVSHVSEPIATAPTHRILIRGNHASEGKEAPPSVLAALSSAQNYYSPDLRGALRTSGRRLALARWLTSPQHPLLARVIVNRLWNHHFGEGIVATLDNLGVSGAKPTHPELLDYLASELIRSNWDLKRLHRLLVTSAVYRQSSSLRSPTPSRDPDNALLWRARARRLDAEELRDASLAVADELSSTLNGPYTPVSKDRQGQIVIAETSPGARRRSLFMQHKRTEPINVLEVFDAPQLNPACGKRTQSAVALQALTLLNSEFLRNRARSLAARVIRESEKSSGAAGGGDEFSVKNAFLWSLGRLPTLSETQTTLVFLVEQRKVYAASEEASKMAMIDCCQMLLSSNEFSYID